PRWTCKRAIRLAFPAPFFPTTPTRSPGFTTKSAPSRSTLVPRRNTIPDARITTQVAPWKEAESGGLSLPCSAIWVPGSGKRRQSARTHGQSPEQDALQRPYELVHPAKCAAPDPYRRRPRLELAAAHADTPAAACPWRLG